MLASVCIKYVHNYSFPSILNSARASYSRRHRLTDANTRVLRGLGKALTVKGMCVFCVARRYLPCCGRAFSVSRYGLSCGVKRAFL